jgi:type VI secretion system protein ImpK
MRLPPLPPEASLALAEFRAFHAELVAVKAALATPALPAPPAADSGAAQPAATPLHQAFAKLYRQITTLGHGRAHGAARARLADCETGYVLAALADEAVLQRLDGPGRDAWAPMLLEDALYGTRVAGERIFELARAAADGRLVGRPDLAVTLLLALLAGFRGRYRDGDDGGEIRDLCTRLFERIHEQPWLREVPWRPALASPEAPLARRRRCAGCRRCARGWRPWPRSWCSTWPSRTPFGATRSATCWRSPTRSSSATARTTRARKGCPRSPRRRSCPGSPSGWVWPWPS